MRTSIRLLFALACIAAIASSANAQNYKPAVEYQSLMNLRFYEADGGFLVEHLEIVFPPQGMKKAAFVITKASGEEVARVPLRFEAIEKFPAFGLLEPDGVPGVVRIKQSGDFVMSVLLDGQTITSLPFSLKEQKSGDPFQPGSKFLREGPQKGLAHISSLTDEPSAPVYVNWWMSTRELPAAGAERARVTAHVLVNGQEIAASRSPMILTQEDWQFFQFHQLSMPTLPQNKWLTLADMTKKDGVLSLVIKADGKPLKTYKTRVAGGQIQRLPENSLDREPRASFISPRYVNVYERTGPQYRMLDMFWMKSDK